jgi:hypothetical protein
LQQRQIPDLHHLRALLSCRKVMQRKCIGLENEIRGLLKVFGVKLPLRLSRGGFDIAVRGRGRDHRAQLQSGRR